MNFFSFRLFLGPIFFNMKYHGVKRHRKNFLSFFGAIFLKLYVKTFEVEMETTPKMKVRVKMENKTLDDA